MTDLGALSLLLVLAFTAFATVAGFAGGALGRPRLARAAERALGAAWLACAVAMGALWTLLVRSDFRVDYVWSHSNRDLPRFYKVTALWAGQEGSLLLWEFVILSFGALVVLANLRRNRTLMPYVVAVIAASGFFFSLLNNFVASPFQEIALVQPDGTIRPVPHPPDDGHGLNPILQHPAMAIHPPVLYIGYVGFVVPFAFCIAALARRELGTTWITTTRRWTLVCWGFLGSGILLGGRWAYEELGWGGYWAWDPVENASLMPWLMGTAFLHSVMIQEKRGMLKVWNVVLILSTYVLAIFGTFTTRSGLMSSVHAFAQSSIGSWFVGYIVALVVGTTALLVARLSDLKTENRYEAIVSRESAFLFNNLLFLVACAAVFWGTMYPVLSEAVQGEKIVVGAPFFNAVEVPIALLLLFLTGVGPLVAWRRSSWKSLARVFAVPAALGAATAGAAVALGVRHAYATIALALCAFVLTTIVAELYKGGRARAHSIGSGFAYGLVDLVRRNKRRYGGYLVHFAIVVLFVGFTGKAFETETKVPVQVGDRIELRAYTLTVEKIVEGDRSNPNYELSRMTLGLHRGGERLATLEPEARFYHSSEQLTSEVARWGDLKEDVYTVFVRAGESSPPEVQVFINPLVRYVWLGGFLMALGTLLCLVPDHRTPRPPPVAALTEAAAAARSHA